MSNLRTAAAELIESLKDPSDLFRINKAIGNVNTALSEPQEGQNGSDDKCLHECPECNCRCNCDSQPCSCCNEPQQTVSRENRHTGKLYREVDVKDRLPKKEGYYRTDSLEGDYFAQDKKWYDSERDFHNLQRPSKVEYWLEPIEQGKVKAEEKEPDAEEFLKEKGIAVDLNVNTHTKKPPKIKLSDLLNEYRNL